ncbi:MAG TPA: TraR/DksA family transcriptional regulator [Vicinamibacteria bacterium]|nr:TraR/DksA family transcriptional regulator [Vicinamibacteria bacterium]
MPRAKHNDQGERYGVLKSMLEDRRREIQAKLRSLRETLPAEVAEVKDAEEQSVHDFVQAVEVALMEMKSATLAKIDEAVRRLEDGSYGVCTECGTEISEARLKALPFAALCRPCQEREEESKIRNDSRAIREFAPTLR